MWLLRVGCSKVATVFSSFSTIIVFVYSWLEIDKVILIRFDISGLRLIIKLNFNMFSIDVSQTVGFNYFRFIGNFYRQKKYKKIFFWNFVHSFNFKLIIRTESIP